MKFADDNVMSGINASESIYTFCSEVVDVELPELKCLYGVCVLCNDLPPPACNVVM